MDSLCRFEAYLVMKLQGLASKILADVQSYT